MCNGPDTIAESGIEWGDGDVVGVMLDYRSLTFTVRRPLMPRPTSDRCAAMIYSYASPFSFDSLLSVTIMHRERERETVCGYARRFL
jgi:hypothetical protein